jgi:hypothetical protein
VKDLSSGFRYSCCDFLSLLISIDFQALEFGAQETIVQPVPISWSIDLILDVHVALAGIALGIPGGAESSA